MAHVQSYAPRMAPETENKDVRELARYVERELETIAKALAEFTFLRVMVLHVAPEKPRDGMLAYADGTNWNPGSGEGHYGYINGSWTKLFP